MRKLFTLWLIILFLTLSFIGIFNCTESNINTHIRAQSNYSATKMWTDENWLMDVAIGDFDNSKPGNEVVVCGKSGDTTMLTGSNNTWTATTMWYANPTPEFVAVGDFYSLNSGDEVAIGTGANITMLSGKGSSWNATKLKTPACLWNMRVGDYNSSNAGKEICGCSEFLLDMANVWVLTYNGIEWTDTLIYKGNAVIMDVNVGDFNSSNPGSEIILLDEDGDYIQVIQNGNNWNSNYIWRPPLKHAGKRVEIGEVDPQHPGNELVIVKRYLPEVIILAENGGKWTSTWILNGTTGFRDCAIGDFDSTHPGNEIVVVGTSGNVTMIWKDGQTWYNTTIWTDNDNLVSVEIGDYDPSHSKNEIVVVGWSDAVTMLADENMIEPPNIGPPNLYIVSPSNGAHLSGNVNISGTASDPDGIEDIDWIKIQVGSATWNSAFKLTGLNWSNWYYNWDTNMVNDGPCIINVNAFDGVNYTKKSIEIIVDNTPPQPIDNIPLNSESYVTINTIISATFNERMNRTSVVNAFSYNDGKRVWNKDNGSFNWNADNISFTFTPAELLSYDESYEIILNGSIARDLAGNTLDGNGNGIAEGSVLDNYKWSFTTEIAPDITPPKVLSTYPLDNTIDALLNITIQVTFSEPMNRKATELAFSISPFVEGAFTWTDNAMIFTPISDLHHNTKYILKITIEATDLVGNTLDGNNNGISEVSPLDDFSWSFTTIPELKKDIIPPKIISTYPLDEAINVDEKINIEITFSEEMNKTLTENAFFISPTVTGTFAWDSNKMIFNPDSNLAYNTTYLLVIYAVAIDVKGNCLDSNNNNISEGSPLDDYSWEFTTLQDLDLPENKIGIFDFGLNLSPSIIKIKPGYSTVIKVLVTNLGNRSDKISLNINIPKDINWIIATLSNSSSVELAPEGTAEFNLRVIASLDAPEGEILLTVEGISEKAAELDLEVKKNATLTIQILDDSSPKKNEKKTEKSGSLYSTLVIIFIIIVLVIILLILYLQMRKKKRAIDAKKEVKEGTINPEQQTESAQSAVQSTLPQSSQQLKKNENSNK